MQEAIRTYSIGFWKLLILAILLFGGWEAYGCYKTDMGSTHRAWPLQVILGGILAFGTVVAATPAILMTRKKRKVFAIAIILICAGLAPLAVRLLWRPFYTHF